MTQAPTKKDQSKVRLTPTRADEFQCPADKQQAFLWDSACKGLAVRAIASGNNAYIHQGKLDGKLIRTTIGSTKAWAIDDARIEARRLQTLLDTGTDPRQAKIDRIEAKQRSDAEKKRQRVTLGDVWPEYIDAKKGRWSELSLLDHQRAIQAPNQPMKRTNRLTVAGPLFELLDCPLNQLDSDRIKAWLEKESVTRATSTARCFRLLRGCINWCNESKLYKGLIPEGAHQNKEVRAAVPKVGTKDDCLQREMLPTWFAAANALPNIVIGTYLQIMVLTGARREEMLELKWSDIDFKWKSITLSNKADKVDFDAEHKDEATRDIPLTPYIAFLLNQLPRRNQWVFSSPTSSKGTISDPNDALSELCMAAEIPHTTLHGLRRTFETQSEWVDCPLGIVAQITGHKPSGTAEKHYKRRPLDLLRKWHKKIEKWFLKQAKIKFKEKNAPAPLRLVA